MITPEEAESIIKLSEYVYSHEQISLDASLGRVIAEDIISDRDGPPFDRVAMDGIAVDFDVLYDKSEKNVLDIEDIQYAGERAKTLKNNIGGAIEVMTGACMPIGTNTVIPYEDLSIVSKQVTINTLPLSKGKNVHRQGTDFKNDEVLLKKGTIISSANIGLLASVGKSTVDVKSSPKICLFITGSELVNVNETVQSHQIRASHQYTLGSILRAHALNNFEYKIIQDDENLLRSYIEEALLGEFDILLLTGAVSKGKKDFVPSILESLGVEERFHKIAQRPGKPLYFGVFSNKKNVKNKMVFGLPGNPTSAAVCLRCYVIESILRAQEALYPKQSIRIEGNLYFKRPLTLFNLVSYSENNSAKIIHSSGSGDVISLSKSDGFVELPANINESPSGTYLRFYSWGNKKL